MADKAGKEYWQSLWQGSTLPARVLPERDTLRNHSHHEFHKFFQATLAGIGRARLIEFGCARSLWLPYFAREFGFDVTGIDYSEEGCRKARAILERDGIPGEVFRADFMEPLLSAHGSFDVGVSFGVVEHFHDTAECLSAFRRFLGPQGLLITMIPNLAGTVGWLQRHLDRRIYDIHVVLDDRQLTDAHRRAGFEVVDCRYIVCSNFGVLTLNRRSNRFFHLKQLFRTAMMGASVASWVVDRHILPLPATRLLSPYIICAARNR